MNCLSAKKIRVHGMKSRRWTTKDNVMQYKSLVNLGLRDIKIARADINVTSKKQVQQIKQLREDIVENRADLENAIRGDRQQLRNALSEHREMQLTYQGYHPKDVIDKLRQDIFNRKKALDRLASKMKQKTETLIKAKLELSELEDNLKFGKSSKLAVELQAKIVTGKVQDAILRKEAALAVGFTYRNMLEILKKDSRYFDCVLRTLQVDSYNQSSCLIRTTEFGQMAMEYLDDRKQEFHLLEIAVKRDMKAREKYLKVVRSEASQVGAERGRLLRRDSDINVGKIEIDLTRKDDELKSEMENIERIFDHLQHMLYVPNYDTIFPCLKQQESNRVHLEDLLEETLLKRDELLDKEDQGHQICRLLKNSMPEATIEYKTTKEELKAKIKEANDRRNRVKEAMEMDSELFASVRADLQQILEICDLVDLSQKLITISSKVGVGVSEGGKHVRPVLREIEGKRILQLLRPKFACLIQNEFEIKSDEPHYQDALKYMQRICEHNFIPDSFLNDFPEEALMVDLPTDDVSVPTRTDIKAKSRDIVEVNTHNPDLVVVVSTKKPKSKKY